jgi:hypothetical protein
MHNLGWLFRKVAVSPSTQPAGVEAEYQLEI